MEPLPWAHRHSPQETLPFLLQIQYVWRVTPSDLGHPPRERHQGLRPQRRFTPSPTVTMAMRDREVPQGWGRAGVSLMREDSSAPPRSHSCSF